jgi:hypothetical protein
MLRAGWSGVRIPVGVRDFSPKYPDWLWGPHSRVFNARRGSLPWVKRPGRGVHHPSPSSTVVKNEWRLTYTPPVCLCGMDRDKFFT